MLAEGHFERIDVFEQRGRFGGVWNYSGRPQGTKTAVPQTDPALPLEQPTWQPSDDAKKAADKDANFTSPMYEGLETNIPHALMRYADAPSLMDNQLFPTREAVLDYLEAYSKEVSHLVHLNTQVRDVRLRTTSGLDIWTVETCSLPTGEISTSEYEAVIIANGHYTVPILPDINGIKAWDTAYPGAIAHSKYYRSPELYRDKKVLVVGNAASGIDICSQISQVAKLPVLVSQRSESYLAFDSPYKETKAEITAFLSPSSADRAVRFADDSIAEGIDEVLFCTGYFYSFPFLSSLKPSLIESGERVQNLYQHLLYIPHPSLAFVGLPSKIIPFRTSEGQAAVIARVWSGRLNLPSQAEMSEWERRRIEARGHGKGFHVLPFPDDFDYHNEMVAWASKSAKPEQGKMPPKWSEKETWQRERFPAMKRAFAERKEARKEIKLIEDLGFHYEDSVAEEKLKGHESSLH